MENIWKYKLVIEGENEMKFDVVIGNPPYNDDAYLGFVKLGHELSKKCTCMITPAKWQAKEGKENEQFRQEIVPYMSKIVSFNNASDVFNIDMAGGINYSIIGKDKKLDKEITSEGRKETVKNWLPELGTDLNYIDIVEKITKHKDNNGNNDFNSITTPKDKRFLPQKSYFTGKNFGDVSEDLSSRFYMWSSVRCIQVPEKSFRNIENMDKYKVYCNHNINNKPAPHIVEPNIAAVRESCLMGYGTLEECKSVQSYYNCRLIWYLAYGMKIGNICTKAFKWVPDPGTFDHIFTDQELYQKYNLTEDEINIIESVIKERK